MAVREVAFELECFEWADERLELAGRWKGLAGRRLAGPVLSLDTESGRRKRLVAMPGGHLGAAEESWRATFAWPGDPAEITGAELEVGGNIVVDLPLPDRRRRRRKRPPVDPGDEALRGEVSALRAQVERLRAELAGRERENMQLHAQLDEIEDEDPVIAAAAGAPTVEIEQLESRQEELNAELERLAGERDRTRAELSDEVERLCRERDAALAELERARAEIDQLREAFSEAAVEADATRDRHRSELAALQDELRAERATIARLTAAQADESRLPPPASEAAKLAVAAPPTQAMTAPVVPAGEETQEVAAPAALDAPGPLQAGARPGSATLQSLKSRLGSRFASNGHAVADDEPDTADDEVAVPPPLRSASAARARAGATVAARRSAAEIWGLRILAAVLVAMLLLAFLLILTSIA